MTSQKTSGQEIADEALALFRQGRLEDALTVLDRALEENSVQPEVLLLKARMLAVAKRSDLALACFRDVLAVRPDWSEVWNEQGALLGDLGRPGEALISYDRALALRPDFSGAAYNRGNALRELERHHEAVESFDRALTGNPGFFQAWNNRGSALHAVNRHNEAVESYDRVLAMEPRVAETWNNRALALLAAGRLDEALQSHEQALALNPNIASAWLGRGSLLRGQRRLVEALESFERAIALDPRGAQAWVNRAIVLRDMKNVAAALDSYDRAIALEPGNARHYYSRGLVAWVEKQDHDAALADMERAVALDPDCPNALGGLLLVRQYGGDWRDFDATVARIDAGVRAGKEVAEPFLYQAVSQSPADLQACSAIHAAAHYPAQPPLAGKTRRPGKIRIGYVSGEFREQATAYLMAGLYEAHDKSRFEIIAYDNGGSDGSAMRRRLEAAFDKMVDVACLSDQAAADRIARDGIDVLVNLNGYFGDHRMGIFAHRPAPVQVNYLGFPATLGAPYMDYILADRMVIPDAERCFYTERVAWLPHSYQANDRRRGIADDVPTRAFLGLPEDALVFCNFNAAYKLTPETFAGWMRILDQAPDSVLWLLEGNSQFTARLRHAAEEAGVSGKRLIFAPHIAQAGHLARLQRADLFLDSLPYNAHTTASDALWAGLPLLTCRGRTFPGRVAASLLTAIDMPELVTEDTAAFEALAVALARDPARLAKLRQKLAQNRLSTPLFDTAHFVRAIETAYEIMLEKFARGEAPCSFAVAP